MRSTFETGDYVHVAPSRDVWTVVSVQDGRAVLSPSSIHLAGRPRKVVDVRQLARVQPPAVRPQAHFEQPTLGRDEAF